MGLKSRLQMILFVTTLLARLRNICLAANNIKSLMVTPSGMICHMRLGFRFFLILVTISAKTQGAPGGGILIEFK